MVVRNVDNLRFPRFIAVKLQGIPTMKLLSLSDPLVGATPTVECGERLVSLVGLHSKVMIDDSPANITCLGYTPTFAVRETVSRRLVDAATTLAGDFSILVKESLRPASLQKFYFERRLDRIWSENPDLSEQEAMERTARFIAPPWVAGHPSGGAIDVTLCDRRGLEVDLGCGYDEDEAASKGACFSHFNDLSSDALDNRSRLFAVLESAGFVNYPFEWWHWSYGDKYWATVTQHPHALYGPVEGPITI
ncbi:peptidase M15D, vanX D-ala-D-ala dipeptidase [Caballeronia udeis]|uniref:D-alanyl-D-alanine dipeptidase n=1 Tax=Caballeronia udeis TaxID=1232866 RepID=A0A158JF98_9BURK|nr:M15 family metallopeptidase [Caballeronia udeis]SAL67325.1 peptidase M15D, vanX D-ala-D-ala dipeptidase [Caballeronia udeis]